MLQRRVRRPGGKCPVLLLWPFSSCRGLGSLRDGVHRGLSRGESWFVRLLSENMRHDRFVNIQHRAGSSGVLDSSRRQQFLVGSHLCDLRMVFPRQHFGGEVSFHELNSWTLLLREEDTVTAIGKIGSIVLRFIGWRSYTLGHRAGELLCKLLPMLLVIVLRLVKRPHLSICEVVDMQASIHVSPNSSSKCSKGHRTSSFQA
jgi:hypothetical protein